ncbi:MAG: tRNA uridine-5-carboxymethylaminomethyl(34) synthesis GTPase MnmE, partial [Clostridia bacterium]|nr:tRNA uridine-5-carboxymethylaminomethyl(34) synthesis GTPase MnmE [Clostridia bacterium]
MLYSNDTIAAPATAPGQGGIAIIRVSGPQAESALRTLFSADVPFESHKLYYGHIQWENEVLDECMAVLMRAPRTYTREDVAELHLHGGSYASRKVLAALYALGIRAAEPGEFTRRAFLNGRIDLSRAEAVMGVISSESDRAARAAMRQLSGGVNSFIKSAQDELLSLLAGVEAALDYPEEISDEEAYTALEESARILADRLDRACDERGARILESGLDVVLCGRPNVGKSSILNALLGQERAIVTNIPGTTRDIVQGSIQLEGVKVNLSDTAGLRDGSDEVEKIGIDKARKAIAHADVTVVVLDAAMPLTDEDLTLLR